MLIEFHPPNTRNPTLSQFIHPYTSCNDYFQFHVIVDCHREGGSEARMCYSSGSSTLPWTNSAKFWGGRGVGAMLLWDPSGRWLMAIIWKGRFLTLEPRRIQNWDIGKRHGEGERGGVDGWDSMSRMVGVNL